MKIFRGTRQKEKIENLFSHFNENLIFEFQKAEWEYYQVGDTNVIFYFYNKNENITLKICVDDVEGDVNIPNKISLKAVFEEIFNKFNWFSSIEIIKS